MKIEKIIVKQLFGYLDYEIPLKPDKITLIHGPNGCGKTTILRLIDAIFNKNYAVIRNTPFKELIINFNDQSNLKVERNVKITKTDATSSPDETRKPISIKFTYSKKGIDDQEYSPPEPVFEKQYPLEIVHQAIPGLERIGPEEWINRNTDEILTFEDILELYSDQLPFRIKKHSRPLPPLLTEMLKTIKVLFIQSQRLTKTAISKPSLREYPERQRSGRDVVDLYSNEIKKIISDKLAESGIIAQSKDRTFPSRLLQSSLSNGISQQEITDKFNQMEEKSKKLIAAGISDAQESLPFPKEKIEDMEKKVLWLYLQDVEEKLKVFDDLQQRIETFMTIINSKLNHQEKSFKINRKEGLVFHSSFGEKKDLAPKELSSGEQHQLVVFYQLLFKASKGSLILIDEPEISQHLEWQRRFLRDLTKVVELESHTFLIATHSPQIINDRWDLGVPLKGGVNE